MTSHRETPYKRIVIKAGTSVLTNPPDHRTLHRPIIGSLVDQIAILRGWSIEVLLVTSGAVAAGREVLGRYAENAAPYQRAGRGVSDRIRPRDDGYDIVSRQVFAAVGQSRLMGVYQELFASHGIQTAQALLTAADLSHRPSYLNVRNTLRRLLDLGVVPVLNENDVVAVDEIGEVFGDNDRLSALLATLVDADLLLILTDIEGLYTADPHLDSNARLIPWVEEVDSGIESLASGGPNPWARGGMPTKIDAARLVTKSGIAMIMCNGLAEDAVLRAVSSRNGSQGFGTLFQPSADKLEARKRWMLSAMSPTASNTGEVFVDAGAASALEADHRSLLPAGVREVKGDFQRGDIIYIVGMEGRRIACGIANYAAGEVTRIRGLHSHQIQDSLGYHYGQEVVHRNNLGLL